MSWTQVLNDVTSRISAASQSLQTFDPVHYTYSPASASFLGNQACGRTNSDPQPSSMSVRVQLDHHNVPFYTNLDTVTGRVVLNLATETSISAINVKLEGESRTILSAPKFPDDPNQRNRQKVEQEPHKLLYKVQTVFPSPSITQDTINAQFTLPAGQYTYPFSLKIPFNNDCVNNSNSFQDLRLGPLLGVESVSARHIKQTLPPTLAGFPGVAEIKYYVKATVVRPKFYQENIRHVLDIRYQPTEPPRPPKKSEEVYARRQHQFQAQTITPKSSKGSFFKKSSEPKPDENPLAIKVDARLPSPAILTCHKPLPLQIVVEKTNDSSASVYLSLLQIELIGFTNVRAHSLARTETGSWILMSQANMNLLLDNPTDKSGRIFHVPARFWDTIDLPDTVTPTFNTCNISRTYELEVRAGLSHGTADGIRPELVVLPLRIPVQIFSGIAPSQKVLNRIATAQPSSSTLTPPRPNNAQTMQHSPITPTQEVHTPPAGSYISPPVEDPNDLPPSYEDAMAEDIAPVDGPRRDFAASNTSPTQAVSIQHSFKPDVKSGSGLNRHPSERLFAQNAPTPPGATGAITGARRRSAARQGTISNASVGASAEVTDLVTGLDMNDTETAVEPRPPPLPARKGTTDTVSGKKGLI